MIYVPIVIATLALLRCFALERRCQRLEHRNRRLAKWLAKQVA